MREREIIKRKETDLEIGDFLWEILRRWRLLAVCMLVGALLLSGIQLAKDMKAAKATPEQVVVQEEQSIADMEHALGAQDMDEVLGAVAMKKQLDEKSNYIKTSELMQINPYEEDVIYLQYFVEGDADVDYAALLVQHVKSAAIDSELVDVLDNDQYAYPTSNGGYVTQSGAALDSDHSFVVRVRGLSQEDAQNLADVVKTALNDYAMLVGDQVGGMRLQLIMESYNVVADEELASLQNQVSMTLKQLNNNLDSLKSNMTGDQLALYKAYTEQLERQNAASGEDAQNEEEVVAELETVAETESPSVHFSVTKFVLGAVIGGILGILWTLLAFLFSARLRSGEEISTLYRTNVLGYVRSGSRNSLDRQLAKWRYHRAGTLTTEEEVELIASGIKVASRGEKVYLSGSDMEAVSQEFLTKLADSCKEKGMELVVGQEISYHADALEQMAAIGRVVFVEQLRNSYYDEMYKEVVTCKEHEIAVLGMIVIGA